MTDALRVERDTQQGPWIFGEPIGDPLLALTDAGNLTVAGAVDPGSLSLGQAAVNQLTPADHNLIAWNFPPYAANSTAFPMVSGTVYALKIPIPQATTITNVMFSISASGSTLTSGQNFAGLYDAAGNRLAITADQTTPWTNTTGAQIMALATPQAVPAGYVYMASISVGTTPPTINRGLGNMNNIGLVDATAAFARGGTSLTALPATITTTLFTTASMWAAVS